MRVLHPVLQPVNAQTHAKSFESSNDQNGSIRVYLCPNKRRIHAIVDVANLASKGAILVLLEEIAIRNDFPGPALDIVLSVNLGLQGLNLEWGEERAYEVIL
eukprot:scaffold316_cov352-Pavlova_lutheri.AAC.2